MSGSAAEQFNIHEAKTKLSRIIERVERGEEIVISRAGKPVAKVVPLRGKAGRKGRGSLRGKVEVTPDWDSSETNQEIAEQFGMSS